MRELAERCVSTTMLRLILTDFQALYFDMFIVGRLLSTLMAMVCFGFLEYLVHKNLHSDIIKAPYHKEHHNKPNSLVNQVVSFEVVLAWFVGLWMLKLIGIVSGHFAAQLLGTYLMYEIFHIVTHAYPEILPRATDWHAVRHHNTPKKNFGVTTRGWDRVFGTHFEDKVNHDNDVQRVLDFIPALGFLAEDVVDHVKGNMYLVGRAEKEDLPPVTRNEPLQMEIPQEN